MPELLQSPSYTQHRNVAAPVGADAGDPALLDADALLSRGFESVAIYWTGAGAADADTLTFRVLFLAVHDDPTITPQWLRSQTFIIQRGELFRIACLGQRVFVRIDGFSNAAVPCVIRASGFDRAQKHIKLRERLR